jgi:16S rRNA processing protein RimM
MADSDGSAESRRITIALLLRPQGRRGELLAEPLTDLPDVFATGRAVVLSSSGGAPNPEALDAKARTRTIESHWFPTGKNAGRVVLQLSGCGSISQAESLAGWQVTVAADELLPLEADTFLVGDLVGCAFYDGEQLIGHISGVEFVTGPDGRTRLEEAAPLLAVTLQGTAEDAEPRLVPFVRAWLESVDTAARRVVMHLPSGLLDAAELEVVKEENA